MSSAQPPINLLGRSTRKLYYEDAFLRSCRADVVKVTDQGVELDRTVAFPEGGGQEGDQGVLVLADGSQVRFVDTRKAYGRACTVADFPAINVDCIVRHVIAPEDAARAAALQPGDAVEVRIDAARREALSVAHTAAHLVYVGVQQVRPDAAARTRGCHIKEGQARFDFLVADRFTPEDLDRILDVAAALAADDLPVLSEAHPDEPEALYWRTGDHVMPCGGTHARRTGVVGPMKLRRKNLGKQMERLSIDLEAPRLELEAYHD